MPDDTFVNGGYEISVHLEGAVKVVDSKICVQKTITQPGVTANKQYFSSLFIMINTLTETKTFSHLVSYHS